jgi:hypothetical protein
MQLVSPGSQWELTHESSAKQSEPQVTVALALAAHRQPMHASENNPRAAPSDKRRQSVTPGAVAPAVGMVGVVGIVGAPKPPLPARMGGSVVTGTIPKPPVLGPSNPLGRPVSFAQA